MDPDSMLADLMHQMGTWGRYQCGQHSLHLLGGFLAGLHMLSMWAVAPIPEHGCEIPVVYNKEYHKDSRVIEWSLVCGWRAYRAYLFVLYFFGVFIGATVLGPLADKIGRKKVFCISGVLQFFAAFASAFIHDYNAFCVILVFYGAFASAGSYIAGFCLTMELVTPDKRTICGTMFSGVFAIGVMLVALWGYLIKNITILQVVLSLHSLTTFGHWWLVDESICWLWERGRTTEAIKIVERACRRNKRPFESSKFEGEFAPPQNVGRSYGILDLFKTPVLRSRALNVAFCWFANSIVYYGLSMNTGNLEGDPYMVLFLLALAEIPAYFLVIFLVDVKGRRSMCASLMFLGGFACLLVAFIRLLAYEEVFDESKKTKNFVQYTILGIVLVGKLAISGSFAIIYNYTAELFPTAVRNSAVGLSAMAARISGMLTPLIGLLDYLDPGVPAGIFGTVAVVSAVFTLFLPETLNKTMPQTIEEGERFGVGDTCFNTCRKKPFNSNDYNVADGPPLESNNEFTEGLDSPHESTNELTEGPLNPSPEPNNEVPEKI